MIKKFTGIVIEVQQLGADKNVTLLTAEEGLVNIQVENSGENVLKFSLAKQPFTFGYFEAQTVGDIFYRLERCTVVETFENLKQNLSKKTEALNIILVVKEIAQYNDTDTPLFYELITALKTLNYDNVPNNLVLTKLLSNVCAGFTKTLNFDICASCQSTLKPPIYLNFENNVFVCPLCKSKNCARFTNSLIQSFITLVKTEYARLNSLSLTNIQQLLQILKENYRFKVSKRFKFYPE